MDMKVKDSAHLHFKYGNVEIQACDVDSAGNVENIDIIVDGNLVMCVNTQSPETLNQPAIAALFYLLANLVHNSEEVK